jgi:hypothetical protein
MVDSEPMLLTFDAIRDDVQRTAHRGLTPVVLGDHAEPRDHLLAFGIAATHDPLNASVQVQINRHGFALRRRWRGRHDRSRIPARTIGTCAHFKHNSMVAVRRSGAKSPGGHSVSGSSSST